ncbi:hypothetical protein HS088_TW08G00548 [Tripterygium wilfordii]|uniref:DUF7026 domain-containing protein n=1 Tax=Tripterygium wilfordii TaxID=458696 RepID=A0A7J7DC81_TRIWF|nr:uncharacterized protein LOC120004355 [Tripterygium wilfordii]KAF5743960.1 hypothetical protein HS088_TW08G00548 [Tripterygium wilfordii]
MALRIHFFSPHALHRCQNSQFHPIPADISFPNRSRTQIPCMNKGISDADLALELSAEVEKMNTHLAQREEAMKKSRELLFSELVQYLDLKEEEVKKRWKRMDEEEKWVLVNGFVSEWGVNFYPLSRKHVKEMVEEQLNEEKQSPDSSSPVLFSGLKKIMGFS